MPSDTFVLKNARDLPFLQLASRYLVTPDHILSSSYAEFIRWYATIYWNAETIWTSFEHPTQKTPTYTRRYKYVRDRNRSAFLCNMYWRRARNTDPLSNPRALSRTAKSWPLRSGRIFVSVRETFHAVSGNDVRTKTSHHWQRKPNDISIETHPKNQHITVNPKNESYSFVFQSCSTR